MRKRVDSRKDAKRAKFGEKEDSFGPWRPFDIAQDMLGAINFLEVGLFSS